MAETIIQKCSEIIQKSNRIVVLTGAGISTESGIKDFRSDRGIYQLIPEEVLSLNYFYQHPKEFYEFSLEYLYHPEAMPNDGHKILAKWEEAGKVEAIITQNIDELHQKAGSRTVIEFHGTIKTATCLNCGKKYTVKDLVQRRKESADFFVCNNCRTTNKQHRYIKPDVVLYGDAGEWFTEEGFNTIIQKIRNADCLLVLGTSLKVTPFSLFPRYRRDHVPMIIVNKGTTPYDALFQTYVIHASIGETLKQIDGKISD